MRKDKLLTMKISEQEKADLKRLAIDEGHRSVAGFIMWLVRQHQKKVMRKGSL